MDEIEFGQPVGDTNGEVASSDEEEYSLANPFLNGMPEEHRTLLAPYVKKWDGQVTKKFQDYSGRLKPYEALGPVEELQRYYNFAQNFRKDPENLFRMMWQGLHEQYGDQFQAELFRILQLEQEQAMSNEQEYEEPEYEVDQFQENVAKELQELREWRENFEQEQMNAVEQQQLDTVLDQMHNAFGDFNDDFIVMELSKHGDVQQAMKAWNELLGKYSSQQAPQQRQAPKIMGGQGGVPSGQVDTSKLRDADRRKAVENMLANLE